MKTIKIDLPDQQAEALQAKRWRRPDAEDWLGKWQKEAASVSVAHLQNQPGRMDTTFRRLSE